MLFGPGRLLGPAAGGGASYRLSAANLLLLPDTFGSAPWTAGAGGNAVVTAGTVTAPDGIGLGSTLEDNSAAGTLGRVQPVTITSGSGAYSGAVYLKAGTSSVASLRLFLGGGTTVVPGEAVINLATGAAQWRTSQAGTSFTVTSVNNGWYRVQVVVTDSASGNTSITLEVRPAFAATYSATLNNAATGTVYAWRAQLVAGAL
jgi:hypothetical protein